MDTIKTIKYKGFTMRATQWSGGTYYVESKEVAIVCRYIAKTLGIRASIRKSRGTIYIKLPKDAPSEHVTLMEKYTRPFVGETFDGMIDLASSIDYRTDDGERLLFGSKYIFVDKDWR